MTDHPRGQDNTAPAPSADREKGVEGSATKQAISSSAWSEFGKHPLIVLLVGTLIGSVIIPQIDRRLSRSRQLNELRTQKAIAFLKASNDTEHILNVLMTAFENHYKDDLSEEAWNSPAFRAKIYNLYEEFDRSAWRWCNESVQEAFLLRLIKRPEGDRALKACAAYGQSLKSATQALDPAWYYSFQEASKLDRPKLRSALIEAKGNLRESVLDRRDQVAVIVGLILGEGDQEKPLNQRLQRTAGAAR